MTGRGATAADREKAQQEQAAAIEAETQVLRQRIVELTALVERMQQEIRAQETAERGGSGQGHAASSRQRPRGIRTGKATLRTGEGGRTREGASNRQGDAEPAKAAPGEAQKTSPPAPARDWWDDNAALIAAIVFLPLLIAAGLLWKRRRGAADEDQWRPARSPGPRTDRAPQAPVSVLRNPTAGLATAMSESASTITAKESDGARPTIWQSMR